MVSKSHATSDNGEFNDPMSVRWLEKYDEKVSKFWKRIPNSVRNLIATLATFLFGISVSGK